MKVQKSTLILSLLCGALAITSIGLLVGYLTKKEEVLTTTTSSSSSSTSTTTITSSSTTTPLTEPWEIDYRIPTTTVPLHYDLYLHPDLQAGTFSGEVTISINVTEEIDYLLCHVKYMNIVDARLFPDGSNEPIELKDYFEYTPNEFLVVKPNTILTTDVYLLNVKFSGALEGHIVGFYKSVYITSSGDERSIATSKFQPTDARRAFPCFDEPSFKSTFSISLVRPSADGYIALSNMPVENEVADDPEPGFTKVTFEKSVPMVTYLVCFIVCDFQKKSGVTSKNKDFSVFATPDQVEQVTFSLEFGLAVLNNFEDYFKIDYPLPKQDMIAIPDFVSGAMEHWGLITYREVNLLYDDSVSSSANKQRVAAVVAHELAHMWFGNLVTLRWWNDLWLNEGFASYLEYKGTEYYPETLAWEVPSQFVVLDLQPVMELDSQLSSHPIVQTVNHPDEITEIFDSISYSKGASVLRMLEDFIGEVAFREGVSSFLRKFEYGNAETQDLWDELQEQLVSVDDVIPINITSVMDTWTRQMGFPVLTVELVDDETLRVSQSRFLNNPVNSCDNCSSASDSPYDYKWDVPVTFKTDSTVRELHWFMRDTDNITIPKQQSSKWCLLNVGQRGYYRVNYGQELFTQLLDNFINDHNSFLPEERSALLDDYFSMSSSGMVDYSSALSLLSYLSKEEHYVPWRSATKHILHMGHILTSSIQYHKFKSDIIIPLITSHFNRLGFDDTPSSTHLEELNRLDILELSCNYGLVDCIDNAVAKFNEWLSGGSTTLCPDIRSVVYKYGVKHSGETEWFAMLDKYKQEQNAQEKTKLMTGLASSRDQWILERLVALAKDESIVRSQDHLSALETIAENPIGTQVVWNFIRNEWEYLVEKFTLNNRYLGRMVQSVTSRFTTTFRLEEMKYFFNKYPESGSGERAREQALEEVERNIRLLAVLEEAISQHQVNTNT